MTFEEISFPTYIRKELERQGFQAPTPIQAQSWPIALKGKNLVSIAQTGSGKTLGKLFENWQFQTICNPNVLMFLNNLQVICFQL